MPSDWLVSLAEFLIWGVLGALLCGFLALIVAFALTFYTRMGEHRMPGERLRDGAGE